MRHQAVFDAILKVIKPFISHFYAARCARHHPAIANNRQPIPVTGSDLISKAD
jgi:hypothetical protein